MATLAPHSGNEVKTVSDQTIAAGAENTRNRVQIGRHHLYRERICRTKLSRTSSPRKQSS
jgi:hypothetical protein